MTGAPQDAQSPGVDASDWKNARRQLDLLVLKDVSKLALVTVDSIKSMAGVCPPDLRDHVESLAYELAGVTVDWVKRWQS